MWIAVLSCALLLLHNAVTEMQYVTYTSFAMKANKTATACFQAVNVSESTPVQIALHHWNWSTPVVFLDDVLSPGGTSKCVEAPIPNTSEAGIASLSVTVGNSTKQKSVVVIGEKLFCVGKLSKDMYESGQLVQFRVLCLNSDFLPARFTILLLEVRDPAGNLLMQERNITPKHYFSTHSYQLIDEAELGYYQFRVETDSGSVVYMSTEVKKYVLPTFEVILNAPSSVNILDETMTVGVSGRYTYDKYLVAKVEISICRKPNSWGPKDTCNLNENGICAYLSGYLGPDGTFNVTVNLLQFQLTHSGLDSVLSTEAVVTENGTDVQVTKTASAWISWQKPTPYFDYQRMNRYYKPGINYTGALTLKDDSNKGIYNETIEVNANNIRMATCVTDKDGNCPFSFDTTEIRAEKIVIEAQYSNRDHCYQSPLGRTYNPSIQYTVYPFFSMSDSYLQLDPVVEEQKCGHTLNIQGFYSLNPQYLPAGAQSVSFMYMVQVNGDIKKNGLVEVTLASGNKGSFSIPMMVNDELAPAFRFTVTVLLHNGEVVAHTQRITVQRCFRHQVSLAFSVEKARPGSEVSLTVNAESGAHCGIRSIDQSMNILSGGQAQSVGEMVFNSRPSSEVQGTWVNGFNLNEPDPPCITKPDIVHNGMPYEAKEMQNYGSAAAEFVNNGMRVMASTELRKPVVCPKPNPCPQTVDNWMKPGGYGSVGGFSGGSGGASTLFAEARDSALAGGGAGAAIVESVRAFFPETWLFNDITVAADGTMQQKLTVPGTVTTWASDAFCISDRLGFGATNGSVNLIAFQPFFVEPTLLDTAVSGEEFVMTVTAFNHLPECKVVELTLAESSDFTAKLLRVENDHCICENGRKTYYYSMNMTKPGTINITATAETKSDSSCPGTGSGTNYKDTVTRQLKVEPEGIPREETQSAFICSKGGTASQTINMTLPENVVKDSPRAYVTCLSDLLGISVRNLDNLVQMPIGCGEQTMSRILSNMVVYNYLDSIKSLDEETNQTIRNNLMNGYARMALFYNNIGCMSTWSRNIYWQGTHDCNQWLTAMTYGAFVQLQKIGVFVDKNMVTQTLIWLSSQQNDQTGAFLSDGRGYNHLMDSNVSYTAYVAEALLKAGHDRSHPVLGKALSYLDTQINLSDDTVGQAMSCYTYALAGDVEQQNNLLAKLETKTLVDGGGVFLKVCEEPTNIGMFHSFRSRDCSGNIYANSYYLKCLLQRDTLSDADLTYAASIAKRIASQMNSNGGFASTMDTVPALSAFATFQKIVTTSKDASNTVTVKFGSNVVHEFTVNSDNNLVLQRADLPNVPASYVTEVNGNGCVFVQATLKYNMKPENMKSSFNLKVWTSTKDGDNAQQSNYNLHFNVSYIGGKKSSEMSILDVTLPSGCRASESSLNEMVRKGICQRYETSKQGHVIFYFNQVTNETTSGVFAVEQTIVVSNRKPSPVTMYSYYYPDEVAYKLYELMSNEPVTSD